jgi:hypothetical protein
MNYRPKLYKEWVDDTHSSVKEVAIRGNEAVIQWRYGDKPTLGQATSADGVTYKGTYSEPAIGGDRGKFHFTLYPLTRGCLLLGSWYSEVNGDEREFLIVLEPDKPS